MQSVLLPSGDVHKALAFDSLPVLDLGLLGCDAKGLGRLLLKSSHEHGACFLTGHQLHPAALALALNLELAIWNWNPPAGLAVWL